MTSSPTCRADSAPAPLLWAGQDRSTALVCAEKKITCRCDRHAPFPLLVSFIIRTLPGRPAGYEERAKNAAHTAELPYAPRRLFRVRVSGPPGPSAACARREWASCPKGLDVPEARASR